MTAVPGHELVFVRGDGAWVWDVDGSKYLDATASLWYANIGYGRTELADAARRQLQELHAYSAYEYYATRPALALADRVSGLAPVRDAAVFFTTAGSDAIDTAAKIVRRYWHGVGRPNRRLIVARNDAYHGMNAFGTSLGGISANAVGFGPLVQDVIHVPPGDTAAVAQLFAERGPELAAFMGEPVIGAGGVYPPPPGYWPEIARLCHENDVLLVLDEVVTGFGRLGAWFGAERFDVEADIVVGAKGITSGYVPLGVVICSGRIQEPFWYGDAGMLRHGYTYSAHATACAVALANLDVIESERLIQHVRDLEPVLAAEVLSLADYPLVAGTRSIGLMAGVELASAPLGAFPTLLNRVISEARARGVLLRGIVGRVLQISPPFVVREADLRLLGSVLREALDAALRAVGTATVASGERR